MTEEFLHHVWRFRLFDHKALLTQSGEQVEVMWTGEHNSNSGPDFFNARIRVGGEEWVGNVELHIRSSDWRKHHHHIDEAYDNVILHVVYDNDEIIRRKDGKAIPTIALKGRVDEALIQRYGRFNESRDWIPCGKQVKDISELVRNSWLERLLIERLERKAVAIGIKLEQNRNNWEETFYHQLAGNFGFKINAEPFEILARSLPLAVITKHRGSALQVEALLYGQAGMLEQHFTGSYPRHLQNEYMFLRKKLRLSPVSAHLWKMSRLRPSNFPAIRIAQFAALLSSTPNVFSTMMEAGGVAELHSALDVRAGEYWDTHYGFDKPSPEKKKMLGKASASNIIINTVVPFLFVYGKRGGREQYCEKALRLLEEVSGEDNSIISKWSDLGMPVSTAWNTQSLLQLKNEYCDRKRCLQCAIGNKLLAAR